MDEIADLPLAIQGKLLAALENREVTRVGAQRPQPVDVRLVAASSIDLAQAVRAGRFNERLYLYLREGQLELPALRERVGISCRWPNTSSESTAYAWAFRCR